MKRYFCDNPECLAHVQVDITINIITVFIGSGLETRELIKRKYVARNRKVMEFCHVCASAIETVHSGWEVLKEFDRRKLIPNPYIK